MSNHHNLRVFTKNMRSWDAEKIRLGLLKWAKQNQSMIKDKSAATVINQYLYSAYVKPSSTPCGE